MGFVISDRALADKLVRNLHDKRRKNADSLEKLSSGEVFTQLNPKPSEQALARGLEQKLRSLTASKRNINDAISLLQTAEAGFTEINNMMTRMKEINIAAANTTMSDQDRRYLFIEYQALHEEINRVANVTEFNGMPLLNGELEAVPETLFFRVDDPLMDENDDDVDLNMLKFDGLKSVIATTEGLGLRSAQELLDDSDEEEGIELEDVFELMEPEDDDIYQNVYEEAMGRLSLQRAVYGAIQTRLNKAINYNDVRQENLAAAKSKISDTDYAQEVTNMAHNTVLLQATTGLLSHAQINSSLALNLIASVIK